MKSVVFLAFVLVFNVAISGRSVPQNNMDHVIIKHVSHDIEVADLDSTVWTHAKPVTVGTYWSGEIAPADRSFRAQLLWSGSALFVRFEAEQHEPLVVSEKPDVTKKVRGLWDRDVCEIFIAPDSSTPNKYFEFEVAPTGEWIDLGIEVTPERRITDWDYASGMQVAAKIDKDKVVEVIKIPFRSLGKTPGSGDIWLGNLFRCVGWGSTRGYLAWRPTRTADPAFHVPSAFGKLEFRH